MPSLFLETEKQGRVTVARILRERVADHESQVLLPEVLAAAGAGGPAFPIRLVLDLSQVELLASAGLGLLITLNKRARESGGQMVVTGLSTGILEAMKLTRLDRLLRVEPTVEGAVKMAEG